MTKTKSTEAHLSIEAKALQRAVAWACTAIETKPKQPVLSAAVLSMEGDSLHVSGFDGDVAADAYAEATDSGGFGKVMVSGHLLRAMADQLDGLVTITRDGPGLRLTAQRARYSLHGIPDGLYPTTPTTPPVVGRIAATDLRELLARAALAADLANAGGVPILQAIQVIAQGGQIMAQATDKYRAHRTVWEWSGDDFEALLPARRVVDLAKALSGQVEVLLDGSSLGLADESRVATIRLLAGEYPAIGAFFVQAKDARRIVVGREEIVHAMKAAAVVVDKPLVQVLCEPDSVTFSAVGDATGASDVTISADSVLTEPETVTLNAAYMADAVAAVSGSHVALTLGQGPRGGAVSIQGMATPEGEPAGAVYALVMKIVKKES